MEAHQDIHVSEETERQVHEVNDRLRNELFQNLDRLFTAYSPMNRQDVCQCNCWSEVRFFTFKDLKGPTTEQMEVLRSIKEAMPPRAHLTISCHKGTCMCKCNKLEKAARVTIRWENVEVFKEYALVYSLWADADISPAAP